VSQLRGTLAARSVLLEWGAGERSSLARTRSRSDIVAQASCLGKRAAPRSSPHTGRAERTERLHSRSGGRRTRPMAHVCSPETRTVPPTRAGSNTENVRGDCTERRIKQRRAGAMAVADNTGGRRQGENGSSCERSRRRGRRSLVLNTKTAARWKRTLFGRTHPVQEGRSRKACRGRGAQAIDPAARRRSSRWGRQAEKPRTSMRGLLMAKAE
jgi:hypothetical protein